jgi:Holliday junction resolvase
MILKHRKDANQSKIIKHLKEVGVSVVDLSNVGDGCGDILVGWKKVNYLFEIKDGDKPKSKRKLTPAQREFHATFKGDIRIIESFDDACKILKIKL